MCNFRPSFVIDEELDSVLGEVRFHYRNGDEIRRGGAQVRELSHCPGRVELEEIWLAAVGRLVDARDKICLQLAAFELGRRLGTRWLAGGRPRSRAYTYDNGATTIKHIRILLLIVLIKQSSGLTRLSLGRQ